MSKPITVLCLSNWGGIAIIDINDHDETVTYKWYDNEPETVPYDYEYNEEDETEAFFLIGDAKYYFHEFMRI